MENIKVKTNDVSSVWLNTCSKADSISWFSDVVIELFGVIRHPSIPAGVLGFVVRFLLMLSSS
jgi:hypothetical protein